MIAATSETAYKTNSTIAREKYSDLLMESSPCAWSVERKRVPDIKIVSGTQKVNA